MQRLGLCTLATSIVASSCLGGYAQVFNEAILPPQSAISGAPAEVEAERSNSPTTYHNGWASIVDGELAGRATSITEAGNVQGIAGADVSLLKNASVISTTIADADGNFLFGDVTPGIYGITIESQDGFAAHSFNAVSETQQHGAMNVYVSKLPRRVVDELLHSLWTPDTAPGSARPFTDLAPRGKTLTQSPQVQMIDGLVYGEVLFENPIAIPANHFVKVFDATGKPVATQRVDSFGGFSFAPPTPGMYNLVVGGGAYACVAVDVVAENAAIGLHQAVAVRFVSAPNQPPVPTTLVISAIGPPPPGEIVVQDEFPGGFVGPGGVPAYPAGGFAGGGFGGGGAGGFGGGGGGVGGLGGGLGGLGGLLGIAGLAVGVAALADDDDGFSPPPGTPIVP